MKVVVLFTDRREIIIENVEKSYYDENVFVVKRNTGDTVFPLRNMLYAEEIV